MTQSEPSPPLVMGVDIGGTGMKAALVDPTTGTLHTERHRIPTPRPATPEAMLDVVRQLRDALEWAGPIGVAFPGVIRNGVIRTAANLDRDWVGVDAVGQLTETLGQPVALLNDADAAGLAEVRLGDPALRLGTTVMCTLGTGIGTALFTNGHLLPNTELGHLEMKGVEAEHLASARARETEDLGWRAWSKRLQDYLKELERLLWPDHFVIGGGVSKKFAKYGEHLDLDTPVQPAKYLNRAGIIGAALAFTDAAS